MQGLLTQCQKPVQQQQQQHQDSSAVQPPGKKPRMATPADAACVEADEVLHMLLEAYTAASAVATAQWDGWRLDVLKAVREVPALHVPLLQRLLDSLQGAAAAKEAPQQVCTGGTGRLQLVSYCSGAVAAWCDNGRGG